MDERILYFRVGIVILAAAIVSAILIMLFGLGYQSEYSVRMNFPQAPGVTVGTPIRKNGVLVGRVSEVLLLDDGVQVTAEIMSDRKIKKSELPRIGTATLFGDAVVEFVPGEQPKTDEVYEDGDLIAQGLVARNPLEALDNFADLQEDFKLTMQTVQQAGGSIDTAGQEVAALARNFNGRVNDDDSDLRQMMTKANKALDDFSLAMASMNEVLGDEELRNGLKRTMEGFPKLFTEAELTLASTRDTLDSFQRLGSQFERVGASAERNLANLENFTQPFGDRGEELALKVERTIDNVDALVLELGTFSSGLSSSEGSLGLLMNDQELYLKLNRAATNIEDATRRMRPILDDVRVFTDKVARDPRQLGVKGALDQRPSGAGLKPTIGFTPQW